MVEHKEEVVISGISGWFPKCNNVDELKELLLNKVNAITIDSTRWKPDELGAAAGTGKFQTLDDFDATFFNAHPKLADVMDPMMRLFVERSVEAVVDAGLSPIDLYGTNTAVFSGTSISDTDMFTYDMTKSGFTMLGRSKTMQANRVSYILHLTGPSFTIDGGWLCGANCLEKAKNMIENGFISSAIVGVSNLVLRPEVQLQFQGLNRLNKNNCTKPFSADADGYNRSDACVVLFLQKISEAKRSYGTLVNVKSMLFGDNPGQLVNYVKNQFKTLLLESYKESNIDPASVEFVEAYGSGIKDHDTLELNVMDEVFCTDRRTTPLKVGSVKGNIGHGEPAGLFMSIAKTIIALNSGYIPPTINYARPNENVKALQNGKIQVVTETTPLTTEVIGINAFGLVNGFSHVILKRNNKTNNIIEDVNSENYIPRLILASGRNEANAMEAVNKIMVNGDNAEFMTLTYEVFTKNINGHFYRSFGIYPDNKDTQNFNVYNVTLKKRPVWYVFSGMGSQWQGMGTYLMKLPIFSRAIDRCHAVLKPLGVDIKNILTDQNPRLFDNILNSFVGISAVQIGLMDILKALEITPDGIVGHSVGELGCAYADGCITAEEMVLAAYVRGRASLETRLIPGRMAAVGLGYNNIKDRLPHDVDVACRNNATNCTISGPVDSIEAFVSKLKSKGVFAKIVDTAGIAYHSRYIQEAGPTLLKYLKEVMKEPKLRSSKWISSSLPESEWHTDLAKYSSAEYHTNNLLNSVLFEEAIKHIPDDAIAIEIAPHGLLQALLKKALPNTVTNISLTKRAYGDSVQTLLKAIGQMYTNGLNVKVQELYPPITFPVSRGTPSLHSIPLWEHTDKMTSVIVRKYSKYGYQSEKSIILSLNDNFHLMEHRIHGQHIIPFSFILINVWKMFVEGNEKIFSETSVQFFNLHFKNNMQVYSNNDSHHFLMIQWGTGNFEYSVNDIAILSGKICFMDDTNLNQKLEEVTSFDKTSDDFLEHVLKDEIYALLEHKGYNLSDNFKNIFDLNVYKNSIQGNVKWINDWIYLLDGILKFPLFENMSAYLLEAPVFVREIHIIPLKMMNSEEKNVRVHYNVLTKEITCDGLKIFDVKYEPIALSTIEATKVKLEEQAFVLFNHPKCKDINEFIYDTLDVIMEDNKFNFENATTKLILCTSFDNDSVAENCVESLKQIVENKISINSVTLKLHNVKNVVNNDESEKIIAVTNVENFRDTTEVLGNKKNSYIIVCSKQKCQEFQDWKIIVQQKFDDNRFLTLMKKAILVDENSVFVKKTNNNTDLEIWMALRKHKSTKTIFYIILNSEPLEGINVYVKEISYKYKSSNLRFLFILDSNSPTFESNQSFYTNQLSKGMIVNIFKHGGWGAYKKFVLHDLKKNNEITNSIILKNISINDELTIKYVGLNFKDLVVEDNTENELGPLEYSGLAAADGQLVMGIMDIQQISSSRVQCDTCLSWPVPAGWTPEDAATVPLAYAMCYYVIDVMSTALDRNCQTILITSGTHPVGRAAVAVCLSRSRETYVVVDTDQLADRLLDEFPQLPRSRIIVNANNTYDAHMLRIKPMGVNIVLNFLSGNGFKAALNTIAELGQFFNFSKCEVKNRENMGTRVFLRSIAFSVVSSSMLLEESDQNKQIIQRAFAEGLNKGVIKPFPRHVLKSSHDSRALFNTIRTVSTPNTFKKVILPIHADVENSVCRETPESVMYQCHPDQIYVIVDNKSDWLDLAEWLVDRGAQKIVVSVKRCLMSSASCRRFDKLLSRNVSILLESDSPLKKREDAVGWLNRLSSSSALAFIFVVNQCNDKKITNLRLAFEQTTNKTATVPFVCISSNVKHICAELKSIGYNAFNVSWEGSPLQREKISKILLSLDMLLAKCKATGSSSFMCSDSDSEKFNCYWKIQNVASNFFPDSVDELHQLLNDKITDTAAFVEVPTRSPRLSQLKSAVPVFVVPGFKSKIMEPLYKQFFYPVFEAQLPERVNSIDELSETLINSVKTITDQDYVSLIGESWGGIVVLKMAQILEARGIMVAVFLLEGDPEILTDWGQHFLSNDLFAKKLNKMYGLFDEMDVQRKHDNVTNGTSNGFSDQRKSLEKTQKALNWIRSYLQALLDTKPLSNKLQTKVMVFRHERPFELNPVTLKDYCINTPNMHIVPKMSYKYIMMDKEVIEKITKMVAYLYSNSQMLLHDKYKSFFYSDNK